VRKSTFIKHINQLDAEDLRTELTQLYTKLDAVKKFYKLELGSEEDRTKLYAKAKQNIASKYATKSFRKPRRPRIQKINAILRNLKKEAIFSYEMIDIYLFTTETAVEFMDSYDFYSQPLHNNIISSFTEAVKLIKENRMVSQYDERCLSIIKKTRFFRDLKHELEDQYENYILE